MALACALLACASCLSVPERPPVVGVDEDPGRTDPSSPDPGTRDVPLGPDPGTDTPAIPDGDVPNPGDDGGVKDPGTRDADVEGVADVGGVTDRGETTDDVPSDEGRDGGADKPDVRDGQEIAVTVSVRSVIGATEGFLCRIQAVEVVAALPRESLGIGGRARLCLPEDSPLELGLGEGEIRDLAPGDGVARWTLEPPISTAAGDEVEVRVVATAGEGEPDCAAVTGQGTSATIEEAVVLRLEQLRLRPGLGERAGIVGAGGELEIEADIVAEGLAPDADALGDLRVCVKARRPTAEALQPPDPANCQSVAPPSEGGPYTFRWSLTASAEVGDEIAADLIVDTVPVAPTCGGRPVDLVDGTFRVDVASRQSCAPNAGATGVSVDVACPERENEVCEVRPCDDGDDCVVVSVGEPVEVEVHEGRSDGSPAGCRIPSEPLIFDAGGDAAITFAGDDVVAAGPGRAETVPDRALHADGTVRARVSADAPLGPVRVEITDPTALVGGAVRTPPIVWEELPFDRIEVRPAKTEAAAGMPVQVDLVALSSDGRPLRHRESGAEMDIAVEGGEEQVEFWPLESPDFPSRLLRLPAQFRFREEGLFPFFLCCEEPGGPGARLTVERGDDLFAGDFVRWADDPIAELRIEAPAEDVPFRSAVSFALHATDGDGESLAGLALGRGQWIEVHALRGARLGLSMAPLAGTRADVEAAAPGVFRILAVDADGLAFDGQGRMTFALRNALAEGPVTFRVDVVVPNGGETGTVRTSSVLEGGVRWVE